MQYYVSLPRGWSKSREWPVVIASAGSSHNWISHLEVFAAARDEGGYPFIVVSPIILTNSGGNLRASRFYDYDSQALDLAAREGRCAFDLDGLRAVAADIQKNYAGGSRFFITGFSGGGSIAEAMTFLHPEALRGAAFAAANYGGRCITQGTESKDDVFAPVAISRDSSRVSLPVRWFNGADDPFATLIKQRDNAMAVAKENGFANLSDTIVPQMPHNAMPRQVLDYFATFLAPSER